MTEQLLPEVLTLENSDEVEAFIDYDQRDLTGEEMQSLEEADKFYQIQCKD